MEPLDVPTAVAARLRASLRCVVDLVCGVAAADDLVDILGSAAAAVAADDLDDVLGSAAAAVAADDLDDVLESR